MRVAALYDIHGNLPGLEAVLAEVEAAAPDLVVVGGDVGPGPMVDEVLDRLAAFGDRARYVWATATASSDREVLGKRLLNAGSVGMPYEDEPAAYWLLLGPEPELRRTDYDLPS